MEWWKKTVFPPLHLKLIGFAFSSHSYRTARFIIREKKAGVFDEPQTHYLINDKEFIKTMDSKERTTWLSLVTCKKLSWK